jgi:hypothetical protein
VCFQDPNTWETEPLTMVPERKRHYHRPRAEDSSPAAKCARRRRTRAAKNWTIVFVG